MPADTMSAHPPPDDETTDDDARAGEDAPAAPEPVGRRWGFRRDRPEPTAQEGPEPAAESSEPAEGSEQTEAIPQPARPAGPRRLRRDRRHLLSQREESLYHLGGLAFELYRHDLLPEGVLRARAVEVAELDDTVRDIDVRLSEVERERQERRHPQAPDPSVGCCLTCRTPFQAEARFCWQCGTQVVPPPVGGDDQVTAVISFRELT